MYTHILVPVDGSEASTAGLREALKLAREQDAKVRLAHVYETMSHAVAEGSVDLTPALRRHGEVILAEALTQARASGIEATAALVAAGSRRVPTAIVEEATAAGADLIAMGTHGRRGVERLLLGSVAEGVARRATVSVLLIRPR
jgi:nucleotide-binding universal stress UspA family protein